MTFPVLDSTLVDFLAGKRICHTNIPQWPYKRLGKWCEQLILQPQRDLQRSKTCTRVLVCIDKANWVAGGVGWGFMRVGSFTIRSLISLRINSKVSRDTLNLFLKDSSSQFWYPSVHQFPFHNSSGPRSFLSLFVITIADITAGCEASVSNSISLRNVSLPFLPLTYIGDLKTLVLPFSYGKKIWEVQARPPSLNFTAKQGTLVPILIFFAAWNISFVFRSSSCYSSRLYTRGIPQETHYPSGQIMRPLV